MKYFLEVISFFLYIFVRYKYLNVGGEQICGKRCKNKYVMLRVFKHLFYHTVYIGSMPICYTVVFNMFNECSVGSSCRLIIIKLVVNIICITPILRSNEVSIIIILPYLSYFIFVYLFLSFWFWFLNTFCLFIFTRLSCVQL